jgi:hypothetical protein
MQELADRCLNAAQLGGGLDVLARSVAASRESEPTRFDYTRSCVVVPALRVRDFQFTGVTRF